MEQVIKFLSDNNIECVPMDGHIATYNKLPFSDADMNTLASFWSLPINKTKEGNWVIDNVEVKVY